MTAEPRIVHSERETSQARPHAAAVRHPAWRRCPSRHEETAPGFAHHGSDELRASLARASAVRLVIGAAYGGALARRLPHESLFAEAVLSPAPSCRSIPITTMRAVYIASGEIDIAGDRSWRRAARVQAGRPHFHPANAQSGC